MKAEIREASPCLASAESRHTGQLKFFAAHHITVKDCKGAANVDLGGYKYILASRQIPK